ncbi:TetR/AcrR family transcriptional regulator [Massilia sp. TWR1-2-2]|uniref:TetR/AcrR family transcriptional regulator n=1 Tax=Massilia sp. TWR1-2-2 TaxID=2804584 RepID=UPI003CE91D4F
MTSAKPDVRQHIIDTGMAIILGKGYSAVGLNEILGAAGVPKGSFYHYFPSKERFGEALLADYVADYLARLDAVLGAPGTAAQRLMLYWDSWIEPGSDDSASCSCLVVKLSGEVADMSEAMRLALLNGTNLIIARIAACLREGGADGSLPAQAEPGDMAQTLYQMWLGAALLTKLRRNPSALRSARAATERLLGLATHHAA